MAQLKLVKGASYLVGRTRYRKGDNVLVDAGEAAKLLASGYWLRLDAPKKPAAAGKPAAPAGAPAAKEEAKAPPKKKASKKKAKGKKAK